MSHGEEPSVQCSSADTRTPNTFPGQASSVKDSLIIGDGTCRIRVILLSQWFQIPFFRKVRIGFMKKFHLKNLKSGSRNMLIMFSDDRIRHSLDVLDRHDCRKVSRPAQPAFPVDL
jgi:hypothetical protein